MKSTVCRWFFRIVILEKSFFANSNSESSTKNLRMDLGLCNVCTINVQPWLHDEGCTAEWWFDTELIAVCFQMFPRGLMPLNQGIKGCGKHSGSPAVLPSLSLRCQVAPRVCLFRRSTSLQTFRKTTFSKSPFVLRWFLQPRLFSLPPWFSMQPLFSALPSGIHSFSNFIRIKF